MYTKTKSNKVLVQSLYIQPILGFAGVRISPFGGTCTERRNAATAVVWEVDDVRQPNIAYCFPAPSPDLLQHVRYSITLPTWSAYLQRDARGMIENEVEKASQVCS